MPIVLHISVRDRRHEAHGARIVGLIRHDIDIVAWIPAKSVLVVFTCINMYARVIRHRYVPHVQHLFIIIGVVGASEV
jgi:hypothetical protein